MRKKQHVVYVRLDQSSGDVVYLKCGCPASVGCCCKHVAATLFQLLDYIELGLSDIPDHKTCTLMCLNKYQNFKQQSLLCSGCFWGHAISVFLEYISYHQVCQTVLVQCSLEVGTK